MGFNDRAVQGKDVPEVPDALAPMTHRTINDTTIHKRQGAMRRPKGTVKGWDEFTQLQRNFVDAFEANGFRSIIKAWLAAGYSDPVPGGYYKEDGKPRFHNRHPQMSQARVSAAKVRWLPHVAHEIQRRLGMRTMSREEASYLHAEVARSDIGEFLNENGEFSLELAREKGLTHLIKSIEYKKDGSVHLELYNALEARRDIMRSHGMFRDTLEIEVTGLSELFKEDEEIDEAEWTVVEDDDDAV